jgi:hypothetical protein
MSEQSRVSSSSSSSSAAAASALPQQLPLQVNANSSAVAPVAAAAVAAAVPISENLTCPLCTDFCYEPTTTPCGHTYCAPCLQRYATTPQNRSLAQLSCPVCRVASARIFYEKPAISVMFKSVILAAVGETMYSERNVEETALQKKRDAEIAARQQVAVDIVARVYAKSDIVGARFRDVLQQMVDDMLCASVEEARSLLFDVVVMDRLFFVSRIYWSDAHHPQAIHDEDEVLCVREMRFAMLEKMITALERQKGLTAHERYTAQRILVYTAQMAVEAPTLPPRLALLTRVVSSPVFLQQRYPHKMRFSRKLLAAPLPAAQPVPKKRRIKQ